MERGVKAGKAIQRLAHMHGLNQRQLEEATGIGHSTMSGYWSSRLGLGLTNGRKIADALGVKISDLGLIEEGEAGDELTNLRLAQEALEETVRLLTERVAALERRPATPRRSASTRQRKAV